MNLLYAIAGMLLRAPVALAQPEQDPCVGLPGGFCEGRNFFAEELPPMAEGFVAFNAGLAIIFVIWGGAQMMLALGDEGKITQGRWTVFFACLGFALTLAIQSVLAFFTERFIGMAGSGELTNLAFLQGVTDGMLLLFNVTFVLVMIWAGLWMVFARGEADMFSKAKTSLYWAIAGALFVNIAHSLVRAVYNMGL